MKLSVVLDKTQEMILEFLLGSAEICLAREERYRSEERFLSNLERNMRTVPREISWEPHIKIETIR